MTPVHFVMRADTSWTMQQQMHLLKNVDRLMVRQRRNVHLESG